MANFFADLLTKGARAVLPKELEYKFGITEKPKVMEFRVGEGLTPEQTTKAREVIATPAGGTEGNFFADVVRAFPRAGARVGVEIGKRITGAETAEIQPKTKFERLVFGDEPIKDIPSYGKETLKGFGLGEEKAGKYGMLAGLGLTALDIYPGGFGKKQIAEKIAKETSEVAIKNIILKNVKNIAEDSVDDLAKSLVKITDPKEVESILGKAVKGVITPDLQPLAVEAKKYKSAETSVYRQMQDMIEQGYKKSEVFKKNAINDVWNLGRESHGEVGFQRGQELFDTAKKNLITDLETAKNLGYKNITDFNRANRIVDELQATTPAIERNNALQRLSSVINNPKEIQTTKSQLTDFYNQAVKGEIIPPIPKVRPAVQEVSGQAAKLRELTPEPKISEPLKREILTSETLTKPYTETTKKAIVDTAEAVNEHPTIVSRVVDSLRQTKTKLVEYVQNADVRVKQLTEKKGVKLDDVSDPYLKMTLYPGKVGAKVENLKTEAKVITDTMKKTADGLKTDFKTLKKEVSDYLYFRHAPERNAALGEKAAGITTKEAQEGLKVIESSPRGAKVKELAERLQKVNNDTLDILKEGGVISDDLHKTLREKYKYHIPLNRIFEETEDVGSVLSGRGFDVKGTGIKKAVGSEREVADIMTNILTNQEQAIIRAEKNIVDQSTLAFARQNKDILGDLIKEVKPQAVGKTFEGMPILEKTQDPSILQLFENGKRIWLEIKDPQLAIALRGVGREKLGTTLNAIAKFTRLYSGLATRFNPEFFLPNKIRDLQETAVYLASQKKVGFKGAMGTLKKDPASIKDVINAFRGADTEGARLYNEMRELGGTTGGMGLSTRKQVELNLEQLEKLANSKTRQIGNKLVEYIDDWNTIFEDSTRLSVYKSALKQGLSKDRAAFLAKEASINFNRMGRGGPVINAIWMFSNASIQGSAKMITSLKNPKVLGATVAIVGGSVAAVNEYNDMADPDWRDKVSKWDRLNGLPVVIPSSDEEFRYITIPVSWGLKPIKVMSEYAYDAISGNEFNAKNMIEDSITAIMDAYNPVGGTDMTSALVPTILDVPVDIARNRSWSGIKLRPDYDPNIPRDVQYFQSLGKTKIGQTAINISETLQDKLGLAVSPADMKYAFDQYISGAGRTVGKFTNLIASAVDDEPLPLDEYPLISRFYRERTAEEVGAGAGGETEEIKNILQEQSRERFDIKQQAQDIDKELQKLSPKEANARFKQIKAENPELAEKLKDVVSERKLGLTYGEKLMKQLGVENGERAKYIDEQIMKLPTSEERNAYYKELKNKKIITDEVAKQIKKLKNK